MSAYQLEQLESEKTGVIVAQSNEKGQIVIDELVNADCGWWASSEIPVRFATRRGGQLPAKVRFSMPELIKDGDRVVANISRSDNPNAPPDHFEGQIIKDKDDRFWFEGTVSHRFSVPELQLFTGNPELAEGDPAGKTISTDIQFSLDELCSENPWKT